MKQSFYCYIVACADGTYYTGWTTDPDRRIQEHNHRKNGATYTRLRRPVKLVYLEECIDRRDAMKRELAIKRLSRKRKTDLVTSYYVRRLNESGEE